MNNVGLM